MSVYFKIVTAYKYAKSKAGIYCHLCMSGGLCVHLQMGMKWGPVWYILQINELLIVQC